MIQKLSRLTTIFTILSLIFIVISCGDDDNKKEFLEGIVNYDGTYYGTYTNKLTSYSSEISFSFQK